MLNTVVVGDLHADRKRKVTYGDSSIWDDRVFECLQKIVLVEKPDQLILLGDIFDSYKPDAITTARLLSILLRIDKVVIIEGNHDRPKNSDIDYVFSYLGSFSGIQIAESNSILEFGVNNYALGWHSTQELFDLALDDLCKKDLTDAMIYLHCNTEDFGNGVDNFISEYYREKLTEKGGIIFTGHDHGFKQIGSLINLGSIIPNTIAELGKKFYWTSSKGIVEIDHKITGDINDQNALVYLVREEPTITDLNKAYYVKAQKEVTKEDLTLQAKNLGIDIISDLKSEAVIAGFDTTFIDDLLGELQ